MKKYISFLLALLILISNLFITSPVAAQALTSQTKQGQVSPQPAEYSQLKDLNQKVISYASLSPDEQKLQLSNITDILKQRQPLLRELIKKDPDLAYQSLLTQDKVLAALPSDLVEKKAQVEGMSKTIVYDPVDLKGHSDEVTTLQLSSGKDVRLYQTRQTEQTILSGKKVMAQGYTLDESTMLVSPDVSSLQISSVSDTSGDTFGDQRTIVIPLYFRNQALPKTSKQTIQTRVFTKMNKYYQEASYHQVSLSGQVLDWLKLDMDETCAIDFNTTAISRADFLVDYRNYDRVIVFVQLNSFCNGFSGYSTLGKSYFPTNDGQVRLSISYTNMLAFTGRTSEHELGHGFGLHHASNITCPSNVFPPFEYSYGSYSDTCYSGEYSNPYSVMGGSQAYTYFDAAHSHLLGWLPNSDVSRVTASGTYTLNSLSNSQGVRELTLSRESYGSELSLQYRDLQGLDSSLANQSENPAGVYVLLTRPYDAKTYLVNLVRTLDHYFIPVGSQVTDPATGDTIKVLNTQGGVATIEITIGKTDFTPPEVVITSPQDNALVHGIIDVSFSAVDAIGIMKSEVYFNYSSAPSLTLSGEQRQFQLDTSPFLDGTLVISVKVYDRSGEAYNAFPNTATRYLYLHSNNQDQVTPQVSIVSPSSDWSGVAPVQIAVSATDNVGLGSVLLYKQMPHRSSLMPSQDPMVGYANLSSVGPKNTYQIQAILPKGTHTLYAVATDRSYNQSTSGSITLTVTNDSAQISFANLSNNQEISKASSPYQVQLSVDSQLPQYSLRYVAEVDGKSGSAMVQNGETTFAWNLSGYEPNSTHTVRVLAYTNMGSLLMATTETVTVRIV
jgi:hypothetical protein